MEIQKRMFPNLSNFAVQIGSFVAVTNLMATRDPARIKVAYISGVSESSNVNVLEFAVS